MNKMGHCPSLPSAAEMAACDAATISSGIPSLELMERAGAGIAKIIIERINPKSVVIFCGAGNNGGDGLVIARHLANKNINSQVIVVSAEQYSKDFIENAKKLNTSIRSFPSAVSISSVSNIKIINKDDLQSLIVKSDLIVDALLGTGQKSAPRGNIALCIEAINQNKRAKIIAVDLPTGIDSDSGQVYDPSIRANITCTIELIKRGLLQYPARENAGEIIPIPIGINCTNDIEFSLISEETLCKIPKRDPDAHKNCFGHVFVIGGSKNMPGAPLLSALSALRTGAGLVTKSHLKSCNWDPKVPEVMLEVFDDKDKGFFDDSFFEAIAVKARSVSSLIVGPGIGTHLETENLLLNIFQLIEGKRIPSVIDADALNVLANYLKNGRTFNLESAVLTPHPGEAARLLDCSKESVQNDRYSSVRSLAQKLNATVVLKGAGTIVYSGTKGYVNDIANAYLATAGSGDVLSGIIGTLLAQNFSPIDAACTGVYIHSKAGEYSGGGKEVPIIASDIVSNIPRALRDIQS